MDEKDPLEKGMQPTSVFLPGGFHGQRSLVGYSPWGYKETDTQLNSISPKTFGNHKGKNSYSGEFWETPP